MSAEPAYVEPLEPATKPEFLKQRLLSLDAYRGLIMVTLAFTGFGLADTAKRHIDAGIAPDFWSAVHYQFDHAQWVGCGYWDLIQPSFMFMVGVAAAYSYARRRNSGQSETRLFLHVLLRSLVLVLLGIFLISNGRRSPEWSLMNVLTQIGLGYPFLYLLCGKSFRTQAVVAAGILAGTWLLYVTYPYAGIDLQKGAPEFKMTAEWAQENLAGLAPAWHKNANVGHAIDLWLLNLLPQKEPFTYNAGGYQTINFIPSLATMLFGLMCGELLRSSRARSTKVLWLFLAGIAGLILGQVLNLTGVCPLVKRIWTPSWAIFSTGWCCLILGSLYAIIDVLEYKGWAWPLVVVGVNSIAIYCMGMLLRRWASRTLMTYFGEDIFLRFGPLWEPMMQWTLVGLVFWLMCFWMYRQKIFVRI
jgi:heparan-alpha-glucosaminide N-acetyltransferase